jgi:hypothetical protein
MIMSRGYGGYCSLKFKNKLPEKHGITIYNCGSSNPK